MEKKLHIKKGDKVIVISGESKGVKGNVVEVSREEGKVIVEKAHMISKHVKPRKQGESGQIVNVEGAIYASKVMLYCDKCGKGVRVKTTVETVEKDGKTIKNKVRTCAKCGAKL